jgi:hypothetical protein
MSRAIAYTRKRPSQRTVSTYFGRGLMLLLWADPDWPPKWAVHPYIFITGRKSSKLEIQISSEITEALDVPVNLQYVCYLPGAISAVAVTRFDVNA